jgi:hypothetical protein
MNVHSFPFILNHEHKCGAQVFSGEQESVLWQSWFSIKASELNSIQVGSLG